MADIVGISKTAFQLLADKVKSAIKEEAEQWKIVQRDLVFITGEFEMMQSFLDTASEERVNNQIVRTWVRQVRDLSYDVEDCIDFVLHLDTTKRSWWFRLLPSCFACFGCMTAADLPVDEAVTLTTQLRARVVDVSQRNIRYNLIVDSASKPMAAMDMVPVQKAAAISFDIPINAIKKSGLLDLAELITRGDKDLHVVSVCGTEGDLVKVASVRKMYSDSRIHKGFQYRAWVKLMHPFNPHEFVRSLMTQFFTHSAQEQEEINVGLDALERVQQATLGALIKEFVQIENNHRYLIVLEDLYTMVQWDAIRSYLPDRKKGSRIVVLTHHPVVASQCTGEPCQVSELGQFLRGHSVRVYYKEPQGFQHDRVQSIRKPEPQFLGREAEIYELFTKTHETRLISVWGMPGVGKSALIKAICDVKPRTGDKFKKHVWVNVSHPFNPTEFCRSLLESLHRDSEALRAEDLINKCLDHLREHVCLFVIDGVQSNEDWEWIKSNLLIQSGDSGSCIIVITSQERIAKHCAVSINDGVYNIKGLHATAANELFEKTLEVEKGKLRWQEEDAPKFLLSKCGGLPRVIITVARYLASKPRDILEQEMRRLSDNFVQEVATNPEFDSLRSLLPWMHSYLHACPGHLKKYMLYLSIFPQDIVVRRRRLIRRWIAEGYSKGNNSISMEKYAEKIFEEVAALSIMQPVLHEKSNKVIGYRVNGLFREYIMSRPVEETIFFVVEVSALENQVHGHGRLATGDGIGQHLAIGSTWERDQIMFESLDFSRLRSLTQFGSLFWSFCVSESMRVLRVLDLENASIDIHFQGIGKLPSRLKFLSLRGHRDITRLPESVAGLLQLQTLDIRDTRIARLPPFITKLRKLQYIRAGTTVAWTDETVGCTLPSSSRWRSLASCFRSLASCFCPTGCSDMMDVLAEALAVASPGVEVPTGIKRLESLQTLGAVHVNIAHGEAILHEIVDSLPQLKKLEVSGISRKRSLDNLMWKSHLESLSLQFERRVHFADWENIYIPESLRSLKMMGHHVKQLPRNINHAENIGKLTLQMTPELSAAELRRPDRRLLTNLHTMRLRVSKYQQDGELRFPSGNFISRLQVLEIACKSTILHVMFDSGAMENLEQLKFHCLQGSEVQVSGLEHLMSLKQVWLLGSVNNELVEAVRHQLDNHRKIPAPKLVVQPRSSEASSS